MASIGDIIKAGISAGKADDDILKDVFKEHPNANTKVASIRWYRSQMKKVDTATPKAPKKTAAAKAVEGTTKGEPNRKAMWEDFKKAAGIPPTAPSEPLKNTLIMTDAPTGFKMEKTKNGGTVMTPTFEVNEGDYTVTFKATTGMEGSGFLAKLYLKGKHVANANDYGDGGPVHWEWLDKAKATVKTVNWKEEPHEYEGTVEEARFAAFCMRLPKYVCKWREDKTPLFVTPDIYLEELVNEVELRKQLKRLTKKIAYVTGDGKIFTVSAPPTAENIKKYVVAHNALVLNTMEEKEAIALLKKYQQ